MARRRNRKSGVEELLSLPWYFLLILAAIAYAVFAWIVPSFFGSNPVLKPLGQAIRGWAWVPAAALCLFALISYAINRKAAPPSALSIPGQRAEPPIREPQLSPELSALDRAWTESVRRPTASATYVPPTEWSLDLLRALEWKRFELICAAYYQKLGFRVETIRCGADGGIDAKLFWGDGAKPAAILQCKAWNTYHVGVKPVRELLGVMAHNGVSKGIFLATGNFTREAVEFADASPIELVTGQDFLAKINELPADFKEELLREATKGDYVTPTCPACGIKMVKRSGNRGEFWGCHNYPRCRQRFAVSDEVARS